MSTDFYQPQPVPPPPEPQRGGGCMRRGCITGCVVVLILGVILLAATVWAGFAVRNYIASMPPDQAPCVLMSIGLRVMDQGIENPGPSTTPQQIADMRRTRDQLQAEYN